MARLDTGWHEHPKILALSMAGMAVHAWSISYCDATTSDGFIPDGAWPSKKGFVDGVKDVVKAGLWTPVDGGFSLHDYTVYNRTRAQIEAQREEDRSRKANERSNGTNSVRPESDRTPRARARDLSDQNPRAPVPGPGDVVSVDLLKNGSSTQAGAGVGDGADDAPRRASPPRATNSDEVNYDAPVPDNLGIVHAEAGVCPLCRVVYTGSYGDHTSQAHRVHHDAAPGNLGGHYRRRRFSDEPIDAPPPEFVAHVEAAHQRIEQVTALPSHNGEITEHEAA